MAAGTLEERDRVAYVSVNDSQYVFAHGKAPRGVGSWAFYMGDNPYPWWVDGASYPQARRRAVDYARANGYTVVKVGS